MIQQFQTTGAVPTFTYQSVAPVVMVPNVSGRPMPVFIAPQQPQVAPVPVPPQPISEEDMKQVNFTIIFLISWRCLIDCVTASRYKKCFPTSIPKWSSLCLRSIVAIKIQQSILYYKWLTSNLRVDALMWLLKRGTFTKKKKKLFWCPNDCLEDVFF